MIYLQHAFIKNRLQWSLQFNQSWASCQYSMPNFLPSALT